MARREHQEVIWLGNARGQNHGAMKGDEGRSQKERGKKQVKCDWAPGAEEAETLLLGKSRKYEKSKREQTRARAAGAGARRGRYTPDKRVDDQ